MTSNLNISFVSLMTGSYQDTTDVQLEHASIVEDKLKNYHNDNTDAYLK